MIIQKCVGLSQTRSSSDCSQLEVEEASAFCQSGLQIALELMNPSYSLKIC